MNSITRQTIIRNYVEPLIIHTAAKVSECFGSIIIEDDWSVLSQDVLVDALSQELGSKGYEVDVYKEGDTVIIDDDEA